MPSTKARIISGFAGDEVEISVDEELDVVGLQGELVAANGPVGFEGFAGVETVETGDVSLF